MTRVCVIRGRSHSVSEMDIFRLVSEVSVLGYGEVRCPHTNDTCTVKPAPEVFLCDPELIVASFVKIPGPLIQAYNE